MRHASVGIVLLFALSAPAIGAETEAAAQAGRAAVIHLRDGGTLECTVLGYADGEFRMEQAGKEGAVPIAQVARIAFGKAVGESVRNPFAPPERLRPRAPQTPPAGMTRTEHLRKSIEHIVAAIPTRQLVVLAARWTNHFRDTDLIERTRTGAGKLLATKPPKGDLDRNLRFLISVLELARGEVDTAEKMLGELKERYPDDREIRDVTVARLSLAIQRLKRMPVPPRRPGLRRQPPRDRERRRRGPNGHPPP